MAKYEVSVDGKQLEVEIVRDDGQRALVKVDGREYEVDARDVSVASLPARTASPVASAAGAMRSAAPAAAPKPAGGGSDLELRAPMPGAVLQVIASVGQSVKSGEALIRLEAMKMENDIQCQRDGSVKEILVSAGDEVREGQVLLVLED